MGGLFQLTNQQDTVICTAHKWLIALPWNVFWEPKMCKNAFASMGKLTTLPSWIGKKWKGYGNEKKTRGREKGGTKGQVQFSWCFCAQHFAFLFWFGCGWVHQILTTMLATVSSEHDTSPRSPSVRAVIHYACVEQGIDVKTFFLSSFFPLLTFF